jgi:hypothetical protein
MGGDLWASARRGLRRHHLAAGAGGQRVCRVGTANGHVTGAPHDAMYPLRRFVHWMGDDDINHTDSNTALSEEFGI